MSQNLTKTTKDRAMIFILITVFLDMVGFGIIIPVLPALIGPLIAGWLTDTLTWRLAFLLVPLVLS